jgi:hypothetical protein
MFRQAPCRNERTIKGSGERVIFPSPSRVYPGMGVPMLQSPLIILTPYHDTLTCPFLVFAARDDRWKGGGCPPQAPKTPPHRTPHLSGGGRWKPHTTLRAAVSPDYGVRMIV